MKMVNDIDHNFFKIEDIEDQQSFSFKNYIIRNQQ